MPDSATVGMASSEHDPEQPPERSDMVAVTVALVTDMPGRRGVAVVRLMLRLINFGHDRHHIPLGGI